MKFQFENNGENQKVANYNLTRDNVVAYIKKSWLLYIVFFLFAFLTAYAYISIAPKKSKIRSKIFVVPPKPVNYNTQSDVLDNEFDFYTPTTVEDCVEQLRTQFLMEKTVELCELNVHYYKKSIFKNVELDLNQLPLKLHLVNDSEIGNVPIEFTLEQTDSTSGYVLYGKSKTSFQFGDTVKVDRVSFQILPFHASGFEIQNVVVQIKSKAKEAEALMHAINIEPSSKTSNVVELALTTIGPVRGEFALRSFLSIYDDLNKQNRIKIADSVLSFLDNRIGLIKTELSNIEGEIVDFRVRKSIADVPSQTKQLIDNSGLYSEASKQQELQLQIIDLLFDYLRNPKNENSSISSLNVSDQSLLSLVTDYNKLQQIRSNSEKSTASNNPVMQSLDNQIKVLRGDILSSLDRIRKELQLKLRFSRMQKSLIEQEKESIPKNEKAFLEFSRQQNIRQEIYLFLLKKREAAAVSKSTNLEEFRIIDPARVDLDFKQPNPIVVYFAAFVLGIGMTNAWIYAAKMLDDKVKDLRHLKNVVNVPILGEIARDKGKLPIARRDMRDLLIEQLRKVAINLNHRYPQSSTARKILVTSSVRNEGKSFVSWNLAAVLAFSGKRTLFIDLDLRKETKFDGVDSSEGRGIIQYLRGECQLDDIIRPVPGSENLFVISSGGVANDPVKLISDRRISALVISLESRFSNVVIDLPPIGVVSDGFLLSNICDVMLFVIRRNVTSVNQIEILRELEDKFKNVVIVANGMQMKMSYGYGKDYSYSTN